MQVLLLLSLLVPSGQMVFDQVAPVRLAVLRSEVPVKFEFVNCTFVKFAEFRLSELKVTRFICRPDRLALDKSELLNVPPSVAEVRSTPE